MGCELDGLRESEETLRKQLEMDRAIIRQYKQNIEHDISEHYKVLKMKEEQLLQKSDYVLREQQKIVAYYMGVLQNRESIIIEQERLVQPDEYIFIGDGIDNKGNDYPLAKLMNRRGDCSSFHTNGWEHTMQILEKLN